MGTVSRTEKPIIVVINGIHAKSGGGVTYLRRILAYFGTHEDVRFHLFLNKDQLDQFYPIEPSIQLTVFDFKPTFFSTFVWEQFSLPIIAWAMGANVVFSPANYGPVFARNHVSLLRNAVSVIRLIDRIQPALYWIMLSIATLATYVTAKRAIAVSEYAARLLTFGLPASMKRKLAIVHHGVMHPDIRRNDNSLTRQTILAVSDIYVQKNYVALVEAFAALSKKYPALRLEIAGREIDRHYAHRVYDLVRMNGIQDKVNFRGLLTLDDVEKLYLDCHIFVFPSYVETFGNPLVEAMSVGAPIACSNTAAMPEIVGDAGLLFDPHSPQDITAKLEQLHLDPELRVELGRRAVERSQRFTWQNCADQTVAVLRDAADKNAHERLRFR